MKGTNTRPRISSALRAGVFIAAGGVLTGLVILKAPLMAWLLMAVVAGLVLLQAPIIAWIIATVLAATLSRLLVTLAIVPTFLNFFHFPLALGAVFVAAMKGKKETPLTRSILFGSAALFLFSYLSWIINGGEILRPVMNWLVFCEPFLLIYAVVRMPSSSSRNRSLYWLLFGVAFLQVPLVIWQVLNIGWGDYAAGSFVGMGAGAHVAGAVALVGSVMCLARSFSTAIMKKRLIWLTAGVVLFVIPVLADAKQVIIAFLPALFLLLFTTLTIHWKRAVLVLPVLSGAVLGSFSYYRPLRMVLDWTLISQGAFGKIEALYLIARKFQARPAGWFLGLGPGNSISRIAFLAIEESVVKPGSPTNLVELRPAPATRELLQLTASNWLFSASSVWSGISSWLGLFGDLGFPGIGIYIWICTWLWKNMPRGHSWEAAAARAVMVMAGVLGFLFSWLEEPGFMLTVALVVALGLVSGKKHIGSVVDENSVSS